MKKVTAALLALTLMTGAAFATGQQPITCQKALPSSKTKTCTDPTTGTSVKVDVDATQTAINTAINEARQSQNQGQQQGQVAEGGNAYSGGNSVQISNPSTVRTYGASANLNLNINTCLGCGTRDQEARSWAEFWGAGSVEAKEAYCVSPTGRKTDSCKGESSSTEAQGEPVCFMDKDGVIHVNMYTDRAACLKSHGF